MPWCAITADDSNWEKASKLVMSVAATPPKATPTAEPPKKAAVAAAGAGSDKKRSSTTALFPIFATAKKSKAKPTAKPAAKPTPAAKPAAKPKPTRWGIKMSRTSSIVEWDDDTFVDCR